MKQPLNLSNHWIPVGVGDKWMAQCVGTREFVAGGKAHTKPLMFQTAAAALLACENAQRGDYDNAPSGDVWRVISNGISTRGERLAASRKAVELAKVPTLTEIAEWARDKMAAEQISPLARMLRERLGENPKSIYDTNHGY